ncbi:Fungalysin metallopeptidase-domain-containing protein [Auriculariales sp. MPI-PUGE-AT-0066]|nr:Fungalysin metallopeptidase-domain-containing protein [Auriculariales sp. MPI-PUGE-AT-0066]
MFSFGLLFAFVSAATALPARHGTYTGPKSTFEVYGRDEHHGHTHYTRANVKTWVPPKVFEVYDRGLSRRALSSDLGEEDPRSAVINFVHNKGNGGNGFASELGGSGADDENMQFVSAWKGPHNSTITYVRQQYAKIPIVNTLANVGLNGKGDVTSYSSNFVSLKKGSSFAGGSGGYNTKPKLTPDQASAKALKELGGRRDDQIKPQLNFFAVEDGLKLTHSVRMHLKDGHMVDAFVDAEDGTMHGLVDYTFELNMRVVPFQNKDITEGYEMLNDVEDFGRSPHGWMASGDVGVRPDSTLGNNVLVASLDNFDGASQDQFYAAAVNSSSPGVFDYAVDLNSDPTSPQNRMASVANVFYVTNMAHDVMHRYGFTSDTFNFEILSDSNGGNDPVIASVQDSSGRNNAQMSTGPDQNAPQMKMFLWDTTGKVLDCGFDNGVVLHEYTHGLTNRMTGGGTAQCLQSVESRGMGEGWSDAFADWVWQTKQSEFKDMAVGSYIIDNPNGIRQFPYSTNRDTNPLTYGDVKGREEEHTIGEVWAQALHNVHGALVRDFGHADDAITNPDGDNGHAVFMRLFIDQLALQPCNPSFTDARTAWIQADKNRYDGKHTCAIWYGFARVGLGVDAGNLENSFNVPSDCPGDQ